MIRRTLAKWHYLLCCAPAYLETRSASRRPADLADHNCPLYTYSVFGPGFPFIDPAGNPVIARVSGKLVTSSIAVMRTAAAAGLELWLCPPYIVSDLLASGALVPLLPDDRTPELEIVALCPIGGIYAPSSGCSSTCWSTGSPKSSAGSMHARPVGPE